MYRRTVPISQLARVCKAGALVLILCGVLGLLAHAIALDSKPGQVAVGTAPDVR